jgi:hypothetical protein
MSTVSRRLRYARVKVRLVERDGDRCNACHRSGELFVDHRIPTSRGGSNDPSNLQLLCQPCNNSKGCLTEAEWAEFQQITWEANRLLGRAAQIRRNAKAAAMHRRKKY